MSSDGDKNKIKNTVVSYVGYIATGIIVLAFFLVGLVVPEFKEVSLISRITSCVLLLFLGVSLTFALTYQALLDGDKNERVTKAREQVNIAYKGVQDKTQYADAYVVYKNAVARKEVISNILKSENLEYENHFNADGTFKFDSFYKIEPDDNEFVKKAKKSKNDVLKKLARGIKIDTITRADVLCQDEVVNNNPLKRPKSEKQFVANYSVKIMSSRIFSAVFGGCFGATFIGISWGEMLYKLIWASILIATAIVSYMKAYRYKTVDYVSRLNQSAGWLDEMKNMIESKELEALKEEYDSKFSLKETEAINKNNIINN